MYKTKSLEYEVFRIAIQGAKLENGTSLEVQSRVNPQINDSMGNVH